MGQCVECGEPLPPRGRRGPARRYCSTRCRVAASRGRTSQAAPDGLERWRPPPPPPPPADPDPDTFLATAILDGLSAAARLRRSATLGVAQPLRWRADQAGREIQEALDRAFPDHAEEHAHE